MTMMVFGETGFEVASAACFVFVFVSVVRLLLAVVMAFSSTARGR